MDRQHFIDWCRAYSDVDNAVNTSASYDKKREPLVMGILNVTPDSFYDGGHHLGTDKAYDHAQAMIDAGVDIIDIGGESSQPGAAPVSLSEELDRVLPIIERIRATSDVSLSIDTYKPPVMQAAIAAGVACINDIFALQQPGALAVAAQSDLPICLMHMQGNPQSMQRAPHYAGGVIAEVDDFFKQRIQACLDAGIDRKRLILDPGFGFGKTKQHNLQLVNQLATFRDHELPLLLGVSRKSTIGEILNQPLSGRLIGGLALGVYAMLEGVSIIRTHDVLETKQACHIIQQMRLSISSEAG
jgi:dihydropteroate synthase